MSLIIVSTTARLSEAAIQKTLRVSSPSLILDLLFNELPEINTLVERICLCTWIADETFGVQIFGNLGMG